MMTGLNNITGKEFPAWEQSVSSVETGRSQRGNGVYSAGDARAMQGRSTLVRAWLRCVVMLVLMVVGIGEMWGQTDYSGTYFIASYARVPNNNQNINVFIYDFESLENNYYLCPTEGWIYYKPEDNWSADGTTYPNPFLTTFKCKTDAYTSGAANALWVIEKAPEPYSDYYYIKHKNGTNEYMVFSNQLSGCGADRMRVHIESTTTPGTNALFSIYKDRDLSVSISPFSIPSDHLTVNGGNTDYLIGKKNDGQTEKTGGPTGYTVTNGIIGIYRNSSTDDNKFFYLEDYITRPTISYTYNSTTEKYEIDITAVQSGDITIKYTTNGTTPTSSIGTTYDGTPFDPEDGVTTIKAIVIVNGEESNVATFTTPALLGTNHKYLIQSQNNGWTVDESTTDFHFYMIPGDDTGEEPNKITKVNTTSLFRPTMEWYFLKAEVEDGVQFYYIVNNSAKDNENNPYYLCWDGTNVCMLIYDSSDAYKFKFKIVESATAGSFNIIPYAQRNASGNTNRFVYKPNDGNNICNANAKDLSLSNTSNAHSQWKFVQPSSLDKTAPFMVSTTTSANFYHIENVGNNGYFIVPPTGNATAVTTTNQNAQEKNGRWYFVVAQESSATDWCTYYHIRNAVTGEYLYFIKDTNNDGACLEMRSTIETDKKDRYLFTWARTATENTYYIIPKMLKDVSLNNFSALRKHDSNTSILTNVTRGAGRFAWTFTPANLFCNDPVFEVEEGVIKIKCNTNAAKIYINTESDTDPTDGSTLYDPTQVTAQNWSTNDQVRIKAIAIVSDGTNTKSSTVITLLNKPDVILEAGPYTYNAADWEPSVTVSIGTGETITTAPTDPATYYTVEYSDNTNAGTASVTITDNEASDAWYIWNVPVTEFTIDKAPLTIKANDKTIGYGDEPDNDGVTYNGFVGDPAETESVLGGTLSYSYKTSGDDPHPYTPYDPQYGNQGSYVITPSGLTSTNYDITFSTGVLTVGKKSIGDGALAEGFTLSFDEDGNVILNFGTHTLNKDVDYTIEDGEIGTKYSTRTLSGAGNYDGSVVIRNAIVHFTTDANQTEWSATFVAETENTDFGHTLPNDISAYIITDIEGSWAIPEPLDYIPTGIPVLLVAHEAKNGFVVTNVNKNDVSQDVQDAYELKKDYNMLKEVTNATSGYVTNTQSEYYQKAHFSTKQIYVLYNNEFVLNKDGYLDKGKVYMENPNYVAPSPAPSPAPTRLKIKWDTISGMTELLNDELTESRTGIGWYTIDGRRLNGKPEQRGLYINGGKKVMVK